MTVLIRTERLGARLGSAQVLSSIDLEVRAGEVLGLIGPNGAGKTSLLRAIAGLLIPQEGRIVPDPALGDPSRAVGYLPQDGEVHWPITVERVVALGRLPYLSPLRRPGAADAAAIAAAMDATMVRHLAGRTVAEVSGGERARILLARVLAGEPRLILADEPVAGLDPRHQLETMALFRAEADRGRAVVLVLHELALAARFCDRLVLLHRGRIAGAGVPDAVLTADALARVYGVRSIETKIEGRRFTLPWAPLAAADASDQSLPGP